MEEEEPEGEAVVEPSREATVHSSGDTPLFLSFSLLSIPMHIYLFFFNTSLLHLLPLRFSLSCQMSPLMRKCSDYKQRKRRRLIPFVVGWKWRGFLLIQRRRHKGFGWRWVHSFVSSCFSFWFIWLSTPLLFPPLYLISSFRGWICWKRLVPLGRRHVCWRLRHSTWRQRDGEEWKWQWQGSLLHSLHCCSCDF